MIRSSSRHQPDYRDFITRFDQMLLRDKHAVHRKSTQWQQASKGWESFLQSKPDCAAGNILPERNNHALTSRERCMRPKEKNSHFHPRGYRLAARLAKRGANKGANMEKHMPLPSSYIKMQQDQPDLVRAYEALGAACAKAGPLDARTISLVKLAISLGAGLEGAAHSHARKAMAAGWKRDELLHVAHLCAPTIGFPSMMRSRNWLLEMLEEKETK
jgi:alkylhydroperoxidase/carboxymuconolactone decarboxylase family protein YurZ